MVTLWAVAQMLKKEPFDREAGRKPIRASGHLRAGYCRIVALISLCLMASQFSPLMAKDIETYRCRVGTLEISGQKYIFRVGEFEEVFDVSLLGIAERTTGIMLGIPGPRGLVEIGFRSERGAFYEYGAAGKVEVLQRFGKERPNEKIVALMFSGESDHWVEIKVEGRTAVCRVDLILATGRKILWSNIPEIEQPLK